jgi:hypothetical protein
MPRWRLCARHTTKSTRITRGLTASPRRRLFRERPGTLWPRSDESRKRATSHDRRETMWTARGFRRPPIPSRRSRSGTITTELAELADSLCACSLLFITKTRCHEESFSKQIFVTSRLRDERTQSVAAMRLSELVVLGGVCDVSPADQGTTTTGARQKATFCPLGSSTVTWQS